MPWINTWMHQAGFNWRPWCVFIPGEIIIGHGLQQFLEFWKINHYSKFLKDFKEWVKKVICLERTAQRFLDLFAVLVNHLSGQLSENSHTNYARQSLPKVILLLFYAFQT